MALVKYNNNSISAVTTAASIPSGVLTLIKTQTVSSAVGSIVFVDGTNGVVLDDTYRTYIFAFLNMHPATDGAEFRFNVSIDTGSNYNVAKTSSLFQAIHSEDNGTAVLEISAGASLNQQTTGQPLTVGLGGAVADESLSGTLHLFSPSSTTFVKHYMSNCNSYYPDGDGLSANSHIGGYANTTSAVDAVEFKMNSGNIDAGTIKMYGLV
jgi:hypothetical protein